VVTAFARVLAATEAAQAELDELDALAGDGDHGMTMVLGWRAVVAALDVDPPASVADALRTAAAAFADVGGTAGPLWGIALLYAGRVLGDAAEVETASVAGAATAAVGGMQEIGGAELGDRTVVDAMAPAGGALIAAAKRDATLAEALRDAAAAASAGAEATAGMEPRRGRAARNPERVRGRLDAGARGAAIFWAAVADV
jgi:phosphoenolpyruvate---glycerone phosphotransferase subunit DhaL